jgi:hypothetical protein
MVAYKDRGAVRLMSTPLEAAPAVITPIRDLRVAPPTQPGVTDTNRQTRASKWLMPGLGRSACGSNVLRCLAGKIFRAWHPSCSVFPADTTKPAPTAPTARTNL